jgi:hypothetical protein
MKITQRGPANTDLSQLVQNDKTVGQKQAREVKSQQSGDSAKVDISQEARKLQKIAELARMGNELPKQYLDLAGRPMICAPTPASLRRCPSFRMAAGAVYHNSASATS